MAMLKNRKTAIIITIVVVILATLLGVRKSLNQLARDVEAMFYDGVPLEEGYTQRALSAHLGNCADASLGLATLLNGYNELADDAEALLSARRELLAATSIRGKYAAYASMQASFAALTEKAGGMQLTDRDNDAMGQYSSTFSGAGTAIQESKYNEKALSFMDGASFIAKILKPLAIVRSPQTFK